MWPAGIRPFRLSLSWLNINQVKHYLKWSEAVREGRNGQKKPASTCEAGFLLEAGNGLLSHAVSRIVPSALTGLTTVFGMGTGVALSR